MREQRNYCKIVCYMKVWLATALGSLADQESLNEHVRKETGVHLNQMIRRTEFNARGLVANSIDSS
jgi:hypothetical protein